MQAAAAQPVAVIDTTVGKMTCILFPYKAPKGVANFIGLATGKKDWRNPVNGAKPPLSDEANKKRLLAEDAIQNKDMRAAVAYYEAGVTADPTWAQGWYNAALIHAEMKEYADAAYCMKHYLILTPDAPDSQVAKDKVTVWDAKAEETRK